MSGFVNKNGEEVQGLFPCERCGCMPALIVGGRLLEPAVCTCRTGPRHKPVNKQPVGRLIPPYVRPIPGGPDGATYTRGRAAS